MATHDEGHFHPSRIGSTRFNVFRQPRDIPRVCPATFRSKAELQELQVARLPCQADEFYSDRLLPSGWTPVLKTILEGIREQSTTTEGKNENDATALPLLRNFESTLVRVIYSYLWNPYAKHVRLTIPADLVGNGGGPWFMKFVEGRGIDNEAKDHYERNRGFKHVKPPNMPLTSLNNAKNGFVSFCRVKTDVIFPLPTGRNVNMMPFVLGDKESLPDDLKPYFSMIDACPFYREEFGKVAYLTIHESHVEKDATQRRPGLHIESPGVFPDPLIEIGENETPGCAFTPAMEHPWGMGIFRGVDQYEGGIYFASNMDDTSQVWDALVDRTVPEIVDNHGGCEPLRPLIGTGTKLRAGELVWMTDCTPHEALPQKQAGQRQFFRLVMPYVSHWYADHSTANPKVRLPDYITVVHGDKFGEKKGGSKSAKVSAD